MSGAATIRRYSIKVAGTTPLIMHSDDIEWADKMEAWKSDPANRKKGKAGDDRTPAYRWVGYCYNDGQNVCMASDNISRCLMEGAAMVPVPGSRAKTFKAQTQSGMRVDAPFIKLLSRGKELRWNEIQNLMKVENFTDHLQRARELGFRLFVKRVRIGQQKHIRVRPMWESWELDFTVSVWDDQISEDVLRNILSYAGTYKGLSDWRPGSKTPGPYGMFRVESMEQVEAVV